MVSVLIFDLDGTLYKSAEIKQKFAEAAYHTFAKHERIPVQKARTLVEEKRTSLKKEQGFSVPYTLTLQSLGVPINVWHRESIRYFDPGDYLGQDERLRQALVQLEKRFRLVVLTNNNRVQTERTLRALGIQDLFCSIYSYDSFRLLKPDAKLLSEVLHDLKVTPDQCCMIGDRYPVDIQPARDMGMKTLEVSGPGNIYTLPDNNFLQEEK